MLGRFYLPFAAQKHAVILTFMRVSGPELGHLQAGLVGSSEGRIRRPVRPVSAWCADVSAKEWARGTWEGITCKREDQTFAYEVTAWNEAIKKKKSKRCHLIWWHSTQENSLGKSGMISLWSSAVFFWNSGITVTNLFRLSDSLLIPFKRRLFTERQRKTTNTNCFSL